MGIFVVQFFYRYAVMTESKYLKSLNDWRAVFWFLFPSVYGTFYGLMVYLFLSQTEEANEMVRDSILNDFDLNIDDVVFLGTFFYRKNGIDLNYKSIFGISIMWGMVTISSLLIVYFGWFCYRAIEKPVSESSIFCKLQKQLFYALLAETLIPVVLLHVPVSVLFLFTIYELNVLTISRIFSITVALFPAIDPLPTMFIIQNYRDVIFKYLRIKTNLAQTWHIRSNIITAINILCSRKKCWNQIRQG
ncbi:unnamed protein product [Caenorhabditis angaria]|uniref:Seven TM Receptor n=1 Tax=Caenorhabditis angaria TaxID=860376 RepID=A0A9P1J6G3_9PELO|nr:unnamed protein product [Caenorhabditis angaria]